jgi:hypothetical protein
LTLLRRMLEEYASQGYPVFVVQERATRYGPEWYVISTRVRGPDCQLIRRSALLGTLVLIPKQRRNT